MPQSSPTTSQTAFETKRQCWIDSIVRWSPHIIQADEPDLAGELLTFLGWVMKARDERALDVLHDAHAFLVRCYPRWWARVMAARTGHTIEVQA